LEVLASEAIKTRKDSDNVLFCPMIDARRMEVYAAFYDTNLNLRREISADIIDDESYAKILTDERVFFFGNGSEKCKSILTHSNAHFIENIVPLASNMIPLAVKSFIDKKFVDTAYFEPFYLKEFQTTTAKNK